MLCKSVVEFTLLFCLHCVSCLPHFSTFLRFPTRFDSFSFALVQKVFSPAQKAASSGFQHFEIPNVFSAPSFRFYFKRPLFPSIFKTAVYEPPYAHTPPCLHLCIRRASISLTSMNEHTSPYVAISGDSIRLGYRLGGGKIGNYMYITALRAYTNKEDMYVESADTVKPKDVHL